MRRIFAVLAVCLLVALAFLPAARAGIVLEASTDALEVVTSSAASVDYDCSWTDQTTTAFTPGKSAGNIASATTTTVVAAPAASTQRNVIECTFTNLSTTTANSLRVQRDVSATNRVKLPSVTLAPGETLGFAQNEGWYVKSATGLQRVQATDISGYNGRSFAWQKVGTAKDAAGYWYNYQKDAGFPGALVIGAPGLNGWTTDCSTATNAAEPAGAAQVGAHLLQDPATGNLFLTSVVIQGSIAESVHLIDLTWYNTGIAVTTTTGQAITFPTPQARDINGSTDGEGVQAAIWAVAALGNAAAVANTTLTYTDSAGNTGNTATFSALVGWQAPATPVIGTWMPFQLAAGDRGIRSIQTITLGTSYVSGTMTLATFRPLVTIPNTVAQVGGVVQIPAPGVRVYPNSCIVALALGSASANTLAGTYIVMER